MIERLKKTVRNPIARYKHSPAESRVLLFSKSHPKIMYEVPNHSFIIDLEQLQHQFHNQSKFSHHLEQIFSRTIQPLIHPI